LLVVSANTNSLEEGSQERLSAMVFLTDEEFIDDDFSYGFRQLMEVAVKALSPGVNDPATAVTSLRSLADLLAYRLKHFPGNVIRDSDGCERIITIEPTFETIFNRVVLPVWDYGKKDRIIQHEMQHLLRQLEDIEPHSAVRKLLAKVHKQLAIDED
jgi:uncharacterized membrane protein